MFNRDYFITSFFKIVTEIGETHQHQMRGNHLGSLDVIV